jgi:hypothetical protein
MQDYVYKGKLVGAFYDAEGKPTPLVRELAEGTHRAKIADKERQNRRLENPNCSNRWAQNEGARTDCLAA